MHCSSCNSCESWLKEHETDNSFSRKVVDKYIDTAFSRRNEPMMILENNHIRKLLYWGN